MTRFALLPFLIAAAVLMPAAQSDDGVDRGSLPSAEIRLAPGETVTWGGQEPGTRSFSIAVVFSVSGLR